MKAPLFSLVLSGIVLVFFGLLGLGNLLAKRAGELGRLRGYKEGYEVSVTKAQLDAAYLQGFNDATRIKGEWEFTIREAPSFQWRFSIDHMQAKLFCLDAKTRDERWNLHIGFLPDSKREGLREGDPAIGFENPRGLMTQDLDREMTLVRGVPR